MAKFIFKKRIGRRSRKDTKLVNETGVVIRKPMYSSVFQNDNDGSFFELDDVQIMRYKRNKALFMFFDIYKRSVLLTFTTSLRNTMEAQINYLYHLLYRVSLLLFDKKFHSKKHHTHIHSLSH